MSENSMNQKNSDNVDAIGLFPRVFSLASALGFMVFGWTLREERGAAMFAVGAGVFFLVGWGVLFWIDRIYLKNESERWARAFGSVLLFSIWGLATVATWWGWTPIIEGWIATPWVVFVGAAFVTAWPTLLVGKSLNLPFASQIDTGGGGAE